MVIEVPERLSAAELRDVWPALDTTERLEGFRLLEMDEATEFFLQLPRHDQAEMIPVLRPGEQRLWVRVLPPDDVVDLLQAMPEDQRGALIDLLDEPTRQEVRGLLAYAEDAAGGLMNPRFARIRPDMPVEEALSYLRRQARAGLEMPYYAYALDREQKLVGVVSFRELLVATPGKFVAEAMRPDPVTVAATLDQEEVARLFAQYDLLAMPVVDEEGRMKGIVTVDDIVDVVSEEATEDIQKLGGMAALDAPYLQTGIGTMLKKRAGWLAALFLGEMLTASAMAHFEDEIAKAVVLALFVPLIISSGGNSGSQATTLVIRAMALGQVSGRMWFNVLRRELLMGLGLGLILATIGVVRILAWQGIFHMYGEHYALVATTVGLSLIGVVIWGTISGAMLPLIMRRLGFDPASASAPFVATLVDVSGLVIYFSVAGIVLRGTLLSEREQHRPSAATVAHVLAAVNTEVAATAGANGGDKLDVIIAEDEKSHALQVHYVVAEKICASRGARVQADGEVILGDLQREQGGAEQDTRPMQLDDFRKLFESADVRAKCRVGADQPAQESQPAAAPSASQP